VAIQSDGRIVVAGSSGGAMFVERLTAGLAPDTSFGQGGVASAYGGQSAAAYGVAVGSDGSVVAAGSTGGGAATAVAKFNSSGQLQWGQGGFGGSATLRAVAVQPNGSIVVVGNQTTSRFVNGLVARLTPGGALDSTFTGKGAFIYSYPDSGYTSLNAVTLQSDGKIVAGGVAEQGPEAIAVRFNSNGSADSSFGTAGAGAIASGESVTVSEYPIGAYGVGIAGGGRVVEAGNYEVTGTEVDQALWAFTPTGSADPTFTGGNGTTSDSPGTVRGPTGAFEACALAIAPDGSLVTVGDSVQSLPDTNPCTPGAGAAGTVSRFIGFGPPPTPPAGGSKPLVTTGAASAITATTARLGGQVNPSGAATTYRFDYGTTNSYGSSTAASSAGAGTSAVTESARLSGLRPSTTYHYRLEATNASGTTYGGDKVLRTSASSKPRLKASTSHVHSPFSEKTLAKSGLTARFTCSASCTVRGTLTIPSGTLKRLRLPKRDGLLASGSTRLRKAGHGKVRIRVSRRDRKLLGRLRGKQLTLKLVFRPTGGSAVTRSQKLALR
jgi:uncharacterized delta-60 repeat protein